MTSRRSSPGRAAAGRVLTAAVSVAVLWTILGPTLDVVAHAYGEQGCCRAGVCCCRPGAPREGPCVRTACRCDGHDANPGSVPGTPASLPPPTFRLTVTLLPAAVAVSASGASEAGFLSPPFHPPRRSSIASR